MRRDLTREVVERAARVYGNNAAAARALHVAPVTLARLCERYDVVPPAHRGADEDEQESRE